MSVKSLQLQIQELDALVEKLKKCKTAKQKIEILQAIPHVQDEHKKHSNWLSTKTLTLHATLIIDSLFAIGQGSRLFQNLNNQEHLNSLVKTLMPVEKFYDALGGIIGYHLQFLRIFIEKENLANTVSQSYQSPPCLDISNLKRYVRDSIRAGIESFETLAEIYVVAGAADRLDLRHDVTDEPLPAAELRFLGKTLLEGLIRDLEAREYLFLKLMGRHVVTPLVLMTSLEKKNDLHIRSILESCNWFNRPKRSFFFLKQPLVPVICKDGNWACVAPAHLVLKPGGHGVLWKLAKDQGALRWLKAKKRTISLIRQINNPIAGIDYGLLAMAGIGFKEKRAFGFASCKRLVKSSEGMDILIESKTSRGYSYCITNIEYTDFEKNGIKDIPEESGSLYSRFPANTNILFARISAIEACLKKRPFPGLLINMKPMQINLPDGTTSSLEAGRLESTMQNVADCILTEAEHKLSLQEKRRLPTFIISNERHKTIAVAKKAHQKGLPIQETPEGAFYAVLYNSAELLKACDFKYPSLPSEELYVKKGPSFLFTYHPALGPLYSIINQKLRHGKLHAGAELKLNIAELDIEHLELKGSLIISAESSQRKKNSFMSGKCILRNVKVQNAGIDKNSQPIYWKYHFKRKEALTITVLGSGEFYAENVTFKGTFNIVVPTGHQMVATQGPDGVVLELKKIKKPNWYWNYSFTSDNSIKLKQINNS